MAGSHTFIRIASADELADPCRVTVFQNRLAAWAASKAEDLGLLAETTGALENWLRAEAVLAARKGQLGPAHEVIAERSTLDLVIRHKKTRRVIEFKVAFNNKNLFNGTNGTGGIRRDIEKLGQLPHDEKYIAVFLLFYSRAHYQSHEELNRFFTRRTAGRDLQPTDGGDFGTFSTGLADAVIADCSTITSSAVVTIRRDPGRWLGFWSLRIDSVQ
jgi:hypothetical protein